MSVQRTLFCRAEVTSDLQLSGTVIRYGDVATLPFGKEVIDAGAFGDLEGADLILNRQHDRGKPLARTGGGGLTIDDSPMELKVRADLPDTEPARDAVKLVRSGILRGFSIEFHALREYVRDRVVHVAEGKLYGISLVDRPAYPDSQVYRHEILDMEPTDCGLLRWKMGLIQRGAI